MSSNRFDQSSRKRKAATGRGGLRRLLGFAVMVLAGSAGGASSVCAAQSAGSTSGLSIAHSGGQRLSAGPAYTSTDGKTEPKFPKVEMVYELTDANGVPIVARAADLKLFSEGKEIGTAKAIRSFEQTGYGLTSILAIDASGSMKGAPLAAIHATIAKFVGQARTQDRVEVLTFADDTKIDVPFGSSKSALTQELQTVQARGKFTRLYDGLVDALDQFKDGQPKRRQILVISDGHDEGSKATLADVLYKAKSSGVVIDSIGLTKDAGQYLGTLDQLSRESSGSYSRAGSADDLEGMMGRGLDAKRATPVASFMTSHLAGDEQQHSVQLHWLPGKLSAPAFVLTPKYSEFSVYWIWGLGGCFFAGLILLIFSLYSSRSARRRSMPVPPPVPDTSYQPASDPGPVRTVVIKPTPYEAFASGTNVQRSATIPEVGPNMAAAPVASRVESAPKFTPHAERAKTQLAVFFDAPMDGPFARLDIRTGASAGQSLLMTATPFTVGAVDGSDGLLPQDSTVSGRHARFSWEGSILKIEDLDSTNGTFLNAQRLAAGRHLLKPGDEIRMGRTTMIVNRA